MKVEARVSGPISGPVPNQGLDVTGGGVAAAGYRCPDEEIERARTFFQDKIFAIIMQRQSQPVAEPLKQRFREIAILLEDGLIKQAASKEEYMDLGTLESRLASLLKHRASGLHKRNHAELVNSSSPVGSASASLRPSDVVIQETLLHPVDDSSAGVGPRQRRRLGVLGTEDDQETSGALEFINPIKSAEIHFDKAARAAEEARKVADIAKVEAREVAELLKVEQERSSRHEAKVREIDGRLQEAHKLHEETRSQLKTALAKERSLNDIIDQLRQELRQEKAARQQDQAALEQARAGPGAGEGDLCTHP